MRSIALAFDLVRRSAAVSIVTLLVAAPAYAAGGRATSAGADYSGGYRKAVEGSDVVKNKLFPKKGRVELSAPDLGFIMNQSYIDSLLVHGSINYFSSEVWGFGIDAAYVKNSDRSERKCIENFYNDPNFEVGPECGDSSNLDGTKAANYGPAYVPIRELKFLIAGNAIWNPVYGKQLMLLSATNYFDTYFSFGGGVAMSDYYGTQTKLKGDDTRSNRGTYDPKKTKSKAPNPGADPSETDMYDLNGRPVPESQTNLMVDFGVGQKYHFLKKAMFKIELRNYTLVGTPSGFDTYFAMWVGTGVRF